MIDYVGIHGFPIKRPLTDQERADRLDQKTPSRSRPKAQMSVIKMNATYLECVDKFFFFKGTGATISLVFGVIILVGGVISPITILLYKWLNHEETNYFAAIAFMLFAITLVSLFECLFYWIFKVECLRVVAKKPDENGKRPVHLAGLTHYPMRFNRKNRKVYVIRHDGEMLIANWDDLYFTLGAGEWGTWSVRGHVLDQDGETVLDTFALWALSRDDKSPDPFLWMQWEFIRRYMENGEEGLKEAYQTVNDTRNVSNRKETFLEGLKVLLGSIGGGWFATLQIPLLVFYAAGRWLAMRVGKIPKWSAEIEAECAISPNDPYVCDEDHPPPKAS